MTVMNTIQYFLSSKRITRTAGVISLLIVSFVAAENSDQPKVQAANDHATVLAVAKASKAWKDAFNAGDVDAVSSMYEDAATMVVKPFGSFVGREEIHAFWGNLIDKGFDDVIYKNTVFSIADDASASVSADWVMNNASGIITNELWVVQPDGSALLREDHFEVFPGNL